jgi:hypothetical protein
MTNSCLSMEGDYLASTGTRMVPMSVWPSAVTKVHVTRYSVPAVPPESLAVTVFVVLVELSTVNPASATTLVTLEIVVHISSSQGVKSKV